MSRISHFSPNGIPGAGCGGQAWELPEGVLLISPLPPALGFLCWKGLEEDLLATGVGIGPWPKVGAHDGHGVLRAEAAGQTGGPGRDVHDFCRGVESTREVRAPSSPAQPPWRGSRKRG